MGEFSYSFAANSDNSVAWNLLANQRRSLKGGLSASLLNQNVTSFRVLWFWVLVFFACHVAYVDSAHCCFGEFFRLNPGKFLLWTLGKLPHHHFHSVLFLA